MSKRRRASLRMAAAIAVGLGVAAAVGLGLGVGDGVQAEATDSFLPSAGVDERLVVIDLDREVVERGRADPFVYPSMLSSIEAAGADAVLLESGIIESANPGLDVDQFDELAGRAMANSSDQVVLAASEVELDLPRPGSSIPVLRSRALSPALAEGARSVGLESAVVEGVGSVVRTVPLVAEQLTDAEPGDASGTGEGTLVPTVSLLGLVAAEELPLEVEERGGSLVIGDRTIPTEGEQRMRVNYSADLLPGGDRVIPGIEVLDEQPAEGRFEGKIVVVGLTDPREGRLVRTPVGPSGRLPAVFVEANALNTLLTGDYLRPAPGRATVATVVALAFMVALATLTLPLLVTPVAAVAAAGAYWLIAARAAASGRLLDVVYPIVMVGLAFAAGIAGRIAFEVARRRRVAGLFSRYVPPGVARQLMDEGEAEAAAAGQRLTVTVVFCDLRGFTPYCAAVTPADVREMLNRFYEHASTVILDHGGTVMQFVGDEVFAVFGAPVPRDDHADAGLACARGLLDMRPALNDDLADIGLAPVDYGVGVHSGDVVAAHVGSSHRQQYTVLGETVNIGARLCSAAAAGEVVASGDTITAAEDAGDAEALGALDLKGVTRPVEGHKLTATPGRQAATDAP